MEPEKQTYTSLIMGLAFTDSPELKYAIAVDEVQKLEENDRLILLFYADLGNTRAVGAAMGISHVTVSKNLIRIKSELKSKIITRLNNAY